MCSHGEGMYWAKCKLRLQSSMECQHGHNSGLSHLLLEPNDGHFMVLYNNRNWPMVFISMSASACVSVTVAVSVVESECKRAALRNRLDMETVSSTAALAYTGEMGGVLMLEFSIVGYT